MITVMNKFRCREKRSAMVDSEKTIVRKIKHFRFRDLYIDYLSFDITMMIYRLNILTHRRKIDALYDRG